MSSSEAINNINNSASTTEKPKPFQHVPRANQQSQTEKPTKLTPPPAYVPQTARLQLEDNKPEERHVHFDETAAKGDKPRKTKLKRTKHAKQNVPPVSATCSTINQVPATAETVFPTPAQRVSGPADTVFAPPAQIITQAPSQTVEVSKVPTEIRQETKKAQQQQHNPVEHFSYKYTNFSTFDHGKKESKEKYEIRKPEMTLKAERTPETNGLYKVVIQKKAGANSPQKEVIYQQLPAKELKRQISQHLQGTLPDTNQPKALPQSASTVKYVPQITNGTQSHSPAKQIVQQPKVKSQRKIVKKFSPFPTNSTPVVFVDTSRSLSNPFIQVNPFKQVNPFQQVRPLYFTAF
jgi:hypothetical protein